MSRIHGVPGIFGGEDYFDENGRLVGYSVPGVFGGYNYYDAGGKMVGFGTESILGGETIHMNPDTVPPMFQYPGPDDFGSCDDFPGGDPDF